MDRTRLIPPDPVEAAHTPVDGVDAVETDTATYSDSDPATRDQRQDQKQFAENEGLANTARPEIAEDVERPGPDPQETMRAAQRGRTA